MPQSKHFSKEEWEAY